MDLENLTEQETTHLERELKRFRSPWRKVSDTLQNIAALAIVAYALNVGIQAYRFTESEAFETRVQKYTTGFRIAKQLAADETFLKLNELYLKGKMTFNNGFEQDMNTFLYLDKKEKATREEFEHELERIYNPLLALE